jgi:hypothetical protein
MPGWSTIFFYEVIMSTVGFDESGFNCDFLNEFNHKGWEMTLSEKICFVSMIRTIRPKIALEIGSRAGGSLQILSRYCDKVHCIDIDPTVVERLGSRFPNVEFHIGDSKEELPKLFHRLGREGGFPQFVHIDGNHTVDGAFWDLKVTLEQCPPAAMHVLMHDTFNPDVRKGMMLVDCTGMPNLHHADFDFMPGVLHEREIVKDQMWGGMAYFKLMQFQREGELIVNNFLNRVVFKIAEISAHIGNGA